MEWLSVSQAADRLQVSEARVRQLAADGRLDAVRHSAGWLIDPAKVENRARDGAPTGRPVGSAASWLALNVLGEVSAHAAPTDLADGWTSILEAVAPGASQQLAVRQLVDRWAKEPAIDRHTRRRVRLMLDDPPPVATWSRWLAQRARVARYKAHPGVLARLLVDGRVLITGARALSAHGADIAPGTEVDAYVSRQDLTGVVSEYRLRIDRAGNVVLRALSEHAPASLAPVPGQVVPDLVAAVDLLDADDSRSRQLGLDWLQRATWFLGRLRGVAEDEDVEQQGHREQREEVAGQKEGRGASRGKHT